MSEKSFTLPMGSYDLIRWLNEQYPPKCIGKGQSLEDAHREAGKRDLVETLVQQMNEELGGTSQTPERVAKIRRRKVPQG